MKKEYVEKLEEKEFDDPKLKKSIKEKLKALKGDKEILK